jgi:hypothetical protein
VFEMGFTIVAGSAVGAAALGVTGEVAGAAMAADMMFNDDMI